MQPTAKLTPAARLGAWSFRNPKLLLLLFLTPPLLWLGVVYLGALIALLMQSFFSIDEFSGTIIRQPTLKTYLELFSAANIDVIVRTVLMAATVTLASAVIAFPIAKKNSCKQNLRGGFRVFEPHRYTQDVY